MLYAIVSDIHGNRQAWETVLADIREYSPDMIVCLGDVVGYGPAPAEALESVLESVDALILGNHDAAIGGQLDVSIFNDNARRLIDWTRDQLSDEVVEFFADTPLLIESDHFHAAHAEILDPERFDYINSEETALQNFAESNSQMILVGHTHEPGIFVLNPADNSVRQVVATDFAIQPDLRYIVNVGSVGYPRFVDLRACYCLFDSDSRVVNFRRLQFDITAYRADMDASGVPSTPQFVMFHEQRVTEEQMVSEQLSMSAPVTTCGRPLRTERIVHMAGDRALSESEAAETQARAAEAAARRKLLRSVLATARVDVESKRLARAQAIRETLLQRQIEAEEAARREAEEQEAAKELARQRKLELAKAAEESRQAAAEAAAARRAAEAAAIRDAIEKRKAAAQEEQRRKELEKKEAEKEAQLKKAELLRAAELAKQRRLASKEQLPPRRAPSAVPLPARPASPAPAPAPHPPAKDQLAKPKPPDEPATRQDEEQQKAAAELLRQRKLELARKAEEAQKKREEAQKRELEKREQLRLRMEQLRKNAATRRSDHGNAETPPKGTGQS